MRLLPILATVLLLAAVPDAQAGPRAPGALPPQSNTWGGFSPDVDYKARAQGQMIESQAESERLKKESAKNSKYKDLAKGTAGKAVDAGKAYGEFEDALSKTDERMSPDFQPPGAPQVPSKCMEDAKCRPCFEQAQEKINKSRKNLEKVRGIYDYTHRFTEKGKDVLRAAGQAGGGIAGLGANAEIHKVDGALDDFDRTVRDKNAELLAGFEEQLHELAACEAKFYKTDDWYERFGFIYQQFIVARYTY